MKFTHVLAAIASASTLALVPMAGTLAQAVDDVNQTAAIATTTDGNLAVATTTPVDEGTASDPYADVPFCVEEPPAPDGAMAELVNEPEPDWSTVVTTCKVVSTWWSELHTDYRGHQILHRKAFQWAKATDHAITHTHFSEYDSITLTPNVTNKFRAELASLAEIRWVRISLDGQVVVPATRLSEVQDSYVIPFADGLFENGETTTVSVEYMIEGDQYHWNMSGGAFTYITEFNQVEQGPIVP